MKKAIYKRNAVRRYTLLQIPELALVFLILYWAGDHFGLAVWIQILIAVVWVIKDVVLFFWIWPAYLHHSRSVHDTMIGKTGESIEPMKPAGYVSIGGELWQAELIPPHRHLQKGRAVQVVDGKGLLLRVKPL